MLIRLDCRALEFRLVRRDGNLHRLGPQLAGRLNSHHLIYQTHSRLTIQNCLLQLIQERLASTVGLRLKVLHRMFI